MSFYSDSVFPTSGQSFVFDWISIVYLVIFLLAIIYGIRKGFFGVLFGLFGFALAFIGAWLLAKPMGGWIYTISGFGDGLTSSYNDLLVSKGAEHLVDTGKDSVNALLTVKYGSLNVMNWVVSRDELTKPATVLIDNCPSVLDYAYSSGNVPSFMQGYITSFVTRAVPEKATESLGFYLGNSLAHLTSIAIGFAVLLVVFLIVAAVLTHLSKKLNKVKGAGTLNRVFGGILGAVAGLIGISLVSGLLTAVSGLSADFYSYLDKTLYLSEDSVYTIGKMFYNHNFLQYFLGYFSSGVKAVVSPSSSESGALLKSVSSVLA